MTIDISIIQDLLLKKPVSKESIKGEFMLNFWNTVQSFEDGKVGSKMDLVVIVRQAIRFIDCRINYFISNEVIAVAKCNNWPGIEDWEKCNFYLVNENEWYYYLRARPWQPSWISDERDVIIEGAAFAYEVRRVYDAVPSDPFILKNTPYRLYNNIAQRDAIRAMITMPKSATLVISIPTGSGKSLCAWLPSVLNKGLTVVIVPTVSLAIDQDEALKSIYAHPTAYYGGADVDSKERRQGIRDRIRANEQSIVFTSPESVNTSLYNVLMEAAHNHQLTHFIIDEAHMVYEWGNEFRPAFQKLAGVRRALLQASGYSIRTVLLSATLTQAALELLKSLFSNPGPFQLYASLQLRDEPSYWYKECTSDEKERYILEAVNNLPRPLILYTSKVLDAKKWYQKVIDEGYHRVGILTGRSTAEDRKILVSAWKKGDIDIIIGTSAFGLGIDKSTVRSVVHACVPESVDRYYQEVGRGGRDGNASISLMIYTEEDKKAAIKLSREKLLTSELGWERWSQLFAQNVPLGNNFYRMDLTERHDIGLVNGDYNQAWNLKTLLLMVLAGMVNLTEEINNYLELTKRDLKEASSFSSEEFNRFQVIEVLDLNHSDELYWKLKIEKVRVKVKFESDRALSTMFELLKGKRCTGDIFKDFYEYDDITVVPACGGCPYCREKNNAIRSGLLPQKMFYWEWYEQKLQGDLALVFSHTSHLIIFHQREDRNEKNWEFKLQSLITWLSKRGIVAFIGSDATIEGVQHYLSGQKDPALLYRLDEDIYIPPVPKMLICLKEDDNVLSAFLNPNQKVPTIILLPNEMKDPRAPHRLLRDMITAPTKVNKFSEFIKKAI